MPINIGPGGKFYATGGAKTLPINFIREAGSLWEDFETTGDWTAANGSVATNVTQYLSGSQSVKLTANSGATSTMTKTISANLSNDWQQLRINVYQHNAIGDYSATTVFGAYFSSNSGFSAVYRTWFPAASMALSPVNTWRTITYPKGYWKVQTGLPNWASMVRIRLQMAAASGKTPAASYDNAMLGVRCCPCVMLQFDDGYPSQYDAAMYMRRYGMRGTMFVIGDWIDKDSTTVTHRQLQDMQSAGWCIANHTRSSNSLPGEATQAAQQAQIANGKADLDEWGLSGGLYIGYPGGTFNADTLTSMSNLGMRAGRSSQYTHGVEATPYKPLVLPNPRMHSEIGARAIDSTWTLATAKSYIDEAITCGTVSSLVFHNIGGAGEMTTANFRAFIDYIYSKRAYITPITIDDYYRASLGSITVPELVS